MEKNPLKNVDLEKISRKIDGDRERGDILIIHFK